MLLVVTKQANANVIDTVDRIYDMLPELKRWIPADVQISVLSDRTTTIRASVRDMQWTLLATIALVMLVVFLFLRRAAATIAGRRHRAAGARWDLCGDVGRRFSIDNISLMALAVSVGFVVDDAIVVIEMCSAIWKRHDAAPRQHRGRAPDRLHRAVDQHLAGRGLHAALVHGRAGRSAVQRILADLDLAIAISTVVSLSLTPMICAHFVKSAPSRNATWLDRAVERILDRAVAGYARASTSCCATA